MQLEEILHRRPAFGHEQLQEGQFGFELGGGVELDRLFREDARGVRAAACSARSIRTVSRKASI
jgi:hypothetical protein